MPDRERPYDLAVSFAGAQRSLAERFTRACESLGLDVFYDRNVTVEMWGRDFIQEFRRVYGGELARYVVPFLSAEYFAGPYPMDEFDSALYRAKTRAWSAELPFYPGKAGAMISDRAVPTDVLDHSQAVRLAELARSIHRGQGRRNPGAAPRGRGPAPSG